VTTDTSKILFYIITPFIQSLRVTVSSLKSCLGLKYAYLAQKRALLAK